MISPEKGRVVPANQALGYIHTYTPVIVDLSGFDTNALHTVTFFSETTGQIVNFNLDDVSLYSTFADVLYDYWAWSYIEDLYSAGVAAGTIVRRAR